MGCTEKDQPVPENSMRHQLQGGGFEITLSLGDKEPNPITATEKPLDEQTKQTLEDKEGRYHLQINPKEGVLWIDTKKNGAIFYEAPFKDGYTHIESALISPKGRYIAMNLTKGAFDPWSRLIVIDTKESTYRQPLDDEVLLAPSEESPCENITIIEKRTVEDQYNECVAEAPQTVYILDFWRNSHTIELIKQFPSSTILYSVDVK